LTDRRLVLFAMVECIRVHLAHRLVYLVRLVITLPRLPQRDIHLVSHALQGPMLRRSEALVALVALLVLIVAPQLQVVQVVLLGIMLHLSLALPVLPVPLDFILLLLA